MDRFLKTKEVKKPPQDFASSHVVCIWGPEGTGKTYLAEQTRGIHLTEEILRTKQSTIDFLDRVRSSDRPIIIDDFETVRDLVGLRELTPDTLRTQVFITSRAPVKLQGLTVLNHEITPPSIEKILKIIFSSRPEADPAKARRLAEESRGSIRYVLQGLDFDSDLRDNFQEPRKDCEILLCRGVPGTVRNSHEHGYMWGVVHEKYVDGALDLQELALIAESMSEAAVVDERMYREQSWEYMPYFINAAVFRPALTLDKSLRKLRPGSMWTKFQNACMKRKKLDALAGIVPGLRPETIDFFLKIFSKEPARWGLTAQDLTLMKKMSTFCK